MDPNHKHDYIRPGKKSGDPPRILSVSGARKTFLRYNLVTGTIIAFTFRLGLFIFPFVFTSLLIVDRHRWTQALYDRQTWHNRQIARIKFSQEEQLEEQTLAASLNNELPRPLDLTDLQPVTERISKKIRNQRIIAENIAFSVHLHSFPPVGALDARYKTYKLRHKELKDMEKKFQEIVQERQQTFANYSNYQKLLDLYKDVPVSQEGREAFKQRTALDLEVYQGCTQEPTNEYFLQRASQLIFGSFPFTLLPFVQKKSNPIY